MKTTPTIFQQLNQVAQRVRSGTETADDLFLMMRHPHLAQIIVRFGAKKTPDSQDCINNTKGISP